MRQWEWRSVWGSGWTCARHTNVVLVQWLMLEASIALFAKRHPARYSGDSYIQLLLVMPGRQPNSLHPAKIEIRGVRWSLCVCSHCLRELGSTKRFSSPAPFGPWPKIDISGESCETNYLFHKFSVLVQRFNAVLLHDSLPDRDCTDY